jgi:hypothetical protein
MIGTRVFYLDEQQPLEGYLAAPDSAHDLPGVLARTSTNSRPFIQVAANDSFRQAGCQLQGYLIGREPVMRISTSRLALCCQSGLAGV